MALRNLLMMAAALTIAGLPAYAADLETQVVDQELLH